MLLKHIKDKVPKSAFVSHEDALSEFGSLAKFGHVQSVSKVKACLGGVFFKHPKISMRDSLLLIRQTVYALCCVFVKVGIVQETGYDFVRVGYFFEFIVPIIASVIVIVIVVVVVVVAIEYPQVGDRSVLTE